MAAELKQIKTININALTEFIAQKTGNKTQQSTTIHDLFINKLPSISTCRRPSLGVTNHIHTEFLRHNTAHHVTNLHSATRWRRRPAMLTQCSWFPRTRFRAAHHRSASLGSIGVTPEQISVESCSIKLID